MRNWSVDTSKFDKKSKEYKIWRLEQLINFGLCGEKIALDELRKNLKILNIDPDKKFYLEFIVKNAQT